MADGYGSTGTGHLRVRALFISDLHLGTRDCQAERLLDLLQSCDAELIYLVGDVVDGWRLKARWHWPRSHDDIVRCLLRKQQDGAHILYIPGNHDEFLRQRRLGADLELEYTGWNQRLNSQHDQHRRSAYHHRHRQIVFRPQCAAPRRRRPLAKSLQRFFQRRPNRRHRLQQRDHSRRRYRPGTHRPHIR